MISQNYILKEMLNVSTPKNVNLPCYVAFKNRSHSKDYHGHSSSSHKFGRGQRELADVTTVAPAKRKGSTSTIDKSSIHTFVPFAQDQPRPHSLHEECIIILNTMDRRVRELTREAACLMEIIIANKSNLFVDEMMQEKVRLMEDKEVQKKYRVLQEKVNVFRKESICKQFQSPQRSKELVVSNPESANKKQQLPLSHKFTISHVSEVSLPSLTIRVDQATQKDEEKPQRKEEPNEAHPLREKQQIQRSKAPSKQEDQSLKHRVNYMSNKAEHFKRKSQKIEETLQRMLREKEETDKINNQVSQEIIRLRAETLNYKMQLYKN